ncbi:DUF1127 domain-containing protein [Rhodospirillum sp. A1_3_36]|uniref:DUF1127 domain-containing protein n=1 Tax=Rhodospirillum sp. A1_3_36 TaxID=3391666 RepID=UPI0039A54B03
MNRLGWISLSVARLRRWLERRAQRRELARLDPALLHDLGLSEEDRRKECAKWR